MSETGIRFFRTPWAALLLLAGSVALFEFTGLDLWLQDHFYNLAPHRWLVDENEPVARTIFYNGPKTLMWLGVLVIATVPALAGLGKKYTNVFCPSETRRYRGDTAYAKLCSPFPADDQLARRDGCFPA